MQNDGGIKRGDRADTGDLKARETPGVDRAGSTAPSPRTEAPKPVKPPAEDLIEDADKRD